MSNDEFIEGIGFVRNLAMRQAAPKVSGCGRCDYRWKAPVTQRVLKGHQQAPSCVAETNKRRMLANNWRVVSERCFTHLVAVAAAIEVRTEATEYVKNRGDKAKLRNELWVPAWYARLLDDNGHMLQDTSHEEAIRLFAEFIRELAADPEKRHGVIAACRLSDRVQVIRGFVFTTRVQAARKRRQAGVLFAQAIKLEEEANELDPPSETATL